MAVLSRTQLNQLLEATIYANSDNEIDAQEHQDFLKEIIGNYAHLVEDKWRFGLRRHDPIRVYDKDFAVIYDLDDQVAPSGIYVSNQQVSGDFDPSKWTYYGPNSIEEIVQVGGDHSPGTLDTYEIRFKVGAPKQYQVYNGANGADGKGVVDIVLIDGDQSPGTLDTYQINYTDATNTTFQVYNGADGAPGPAGNGQVDVSSRQLNASVSVSSTAAAIDFPTELKQVGNSVVWNATSKKFEINTDGTYIITLSQIKYLQLQDNLTWLLVGLPLNAPVAKFSTDNQGHTFSTTLELWLTAGTEFNLQHAIPDNNPNSDYIPNLIMTVSRSQHGNDGESAKIIEVSSLPAFGSHDPLGIYVVNP